MKLIVNHGHSLKKPDGNMLQAGQEVTEADVHPDNVKALLRDRVVLEIPDGVTLDQHLEVVKAKRIKPQPVGKWPHDPDGLRGLTLEHLNLMVLDIDPEMAPFDTEAEAIAQLSMDYVPPVEA